MTVVTLFNREVEEILLHRLVRRRGVPSYKGYLVKWCNLSDSEVSWEDEDRLVVAFRGQDQEVSRGWHNKDVLSVGG